MRTGTSCWAHGSRVHLFGDAVSRSRANERDIAPLSSTCKRSGLKLSSRGPTASLSSPIDPSVLFEASRLQKTDEEGEASSGALLGPMRSMNKGGRWEGPVLAGHARSQLDSEPVGEGSESNSRRFDPFTRRRPSRALSRPPANQATSEPRRKIVVSEVRHARRRPASRRPRRHRPPTSTLSVEPAAPRGKGPCACSRPRTRDSKPRHGPNAAPLWWMRRW